MMEDLILSCKEHRLLQKFQKRLQKRYNVKIQMPDTATSSESDVIFISIMGEKHNRERVKKFLSERMKLNSERNESEANVPLITISDSEEEETTGSESKENSIYVLEKRNCAKLLPKLVNKSPVCNSLDNSICIIEPPESFAESNKLVEKTGNINIRKRKRMMGRKLRRKKVITKDALELSKESELCEVSSTTEEITPKKVKLNEEVSCISKEVEDFIPLFQESKVKLNEEVSCISKEAEDFIPLCQENKSCVEETEKRKDDDVLDEPPSAIRPLRPIVIDGSNVAVTHGASHCFSAKGIKLAVDYFLNRGHTQVTAFVPKFRRFSNPNRRFTTKDPEILEDLAKKQHVVFTPSRRLNGKFIASYDDRFIVQLASTNGGVIVSNDNYRDLVEESDAFKEAIENRLLQYLFVGDLFMIPSDPMGRNGPSLNDFLSFPPDGKT